MWLGVIDFSEKHANIGTLFEPLYMPYIVSVSKDIKSVNKD